MSSYEKERQFFLFHFAREFPDAPQEIATKLLREATTQQRISETLCSIDVGEREQTRLEKRDDASQYRVECLAKSIRAKVIHGGDPRGFPFLLVCPSGRTYDFGGRGLGVPGRGLPVSAFQ